LKIKLRIVIPTASGWAFSTGTNQASIVAFADIDNQSMQ